jgi:hypothetical protein
MSSKYNIMMFVYENDANFRSPFFHDLSFLLKKDNTIPINIFYYSYDFFGNQHITITRDTYTSQKIKNIPDSYKYIKPKFEELYNKFYIKGKKNIFYFGGHAAIIFKDHKYALKTNIFENLYDLELIILDCCYSSYTNLLSTIMDKTNYVLACQTPSPNYGFLSEKFLDVLNSSETDVNKYKKIIDYYIKRNSSTDQFKKKFNYRTDGTLIDMDKYIDMFEYIKDVELVKNAKCKMENLSDYLYYDLKCLVNDKELDRLIKKCVIYQKMNALSKEYLKNKNMNLSGLNVGFK